MVEFLNILEISQKLAEMKLALVEVIKNIKSAVCSIYIIYNGYGMVSLRPYRTNLINNKKL